MICRPWLVMLLIFLYLTSFAQQADSLFCLLETETVPSKKIDILLELGRTYIYKNPSEYRKYAQKAYDIFQQEKIEDDSLKAQILLDLGIGFGLSIDTAQCFAYLKQAKHLAEQLDNAYLLIGIHGEMGLTYGDLELFDKAIIHYQKSLKIAEQIDDINGILMNVNNMGLSFLALNILDKAEYYFQKNYQLSRKNKMHHDCAIALTNLGIIYQDQKKYDEALNYFKKSMQITDSLGLIYGMMINHLNIGSVYFEKDFLEAALQHQEEAYNLAQTLSPVEQARCALPIALIKLKQKKYQISIQKAQEALKLGKEILGKSETAEIYKCLADNYTALNQYKKALAFYDFYEKERDTVFDRDRIKIFAEMEFRFQSEKKETENRFLKKEQLKNKTIIQQRTIIAIVVGLGLLLLTTLALILFQKNKQKHQYNHRLKQKVKERTLHLEESNQKLRAANMELERFAYITSHDLKEPLRNISSFAGLIARKIQQGQYADLEEYLQFIRKNATQMDDLIQDILTFSRIEKNEQKKQCISLAAIIDKVKGDLQFFIKEKKAYIIYSTPSISKNAESILLPAQLSLVFKNLIENGIKYNKNPHPIIQIHYRKEANLQIFSIQDNGIGINKAYHKQVFEMFKRLHNRGEYEGSGIGLAICKKIIQSLGGELNIISQEHQGSTFEMCIPLKLHIVSPNKSELTNS